METEPKKTATIYSRVPETLKTEFKQALEAVGLAEAFFLRKAAEALVHHVRAGDDLALPIRLLTVEQKLKKKTKRPRS